MLAERVVIKIDKTPAPQKKRAGRQRSKHVSDIIDSLCKLEEGQSCLITGPKLKTIMYAVNQGKKLTDKKFITRKVREGIQLGIRIWRD